MPELSGSGSYGNLLLNSNKTGAFNTKTIQILSSLHNLTLGKQDQVTEQNARECQENLAGLCVLSRKEAAKSIILRSVTKILLAVFSKYRASGMTLQSACDLTWSLAYHDQNVQQTFAETGVSSAVFECAKRHPQNVNLLKSAFGAVSSLCRFKQNQLLAAKSGLVDFLIKTLAKEGNGDTTLLQYSLDACASVCHANEENGKRLLEAGGVISVVQALKTHVYSPVIVRSACIVLVVLRDRPGGSKVIFESGAIQSILNAIETHNSQPDLEHILCALTGQLLREVPMGVEDVIAHGGVQTILGCVAKNNTHYFIVEACCLILSTCCTAFLKSVETSRGNKQDKNPILSSLATILCETPWEGFLGIFAQDAGNVSKPNIFISALKVLTHFCSVTQSIGANKLAQSCPFVLERIFALMEQLNGNTKAQFLAAASGFFQTRAVHGLVLSVDTWTCCWIAKASTQESIEDYIEAFSLTKALDHESNCLLTWASLQDNLLNLKSIREVIKGAICKLGAIDKDKKGCTHRRDPKILCEVHAVFSLVSALLLCREDRQGAPDLLEQESFWTEINTLALAWLRELRALESFDFDMEFEEQERLCLQVMISLLGFLASTLYKERQLTLRSMAGNGGVTLVLQLQKIIKQLFNSNKTERNEDDTSRDEDDNSPFPDQRALDLLCSVGLEAAGTILKLIGAGTSPSFPARPSAALLEAGFAAVSEKQLAYERELRAKGGDVRDEEEENCSYHQENEESVFESKGLQTEEQDEGEVEEEEKQDNDAEDEGNEDEEDENCNDDSDADESDDDGEVPAVMEYTCDEDQEQNATAMSAESDTNETSGEGLCKPYSRPENILAQPRFVADLSGLLYNAHIDNIEPCLPSSSKKLDVAVLKSMSDHADRVLVYDWRKAGGEGMGRARSSVVQHSPVGYANVTPLQEPSLKSFLVQDISQFAGQMEEDEKNHFLRFESRFESGNLLQALRVNPTEYDLVLRSDLHTRSHHQWFYFAVTNTHPKGQTGPMEYKFNIVNMSKPSSMFCNGMQPVLYSFKKAREENIGWRRAGSNVAYFANSYETPANTGKKAGGHYYTLTFTMRFEHSDDVHLIAMCYPYTYTRLQNFLGSVCTEEKSDICRRSLLCSSLGGLRCDQLTITDFSAASADLATRPAVVLTARVHPGEVVASFMIEGTIRFLLGESALAKLLRSLYVFKIVPMLNPDGVYHGNSRTSLTGCDLNRTWTKPEPHVFPTIWHTKQMIKEMIVSRKVALYADFHGHSRKKNIFIYGVEYKKQSSTSFAGELYGNPVRQFPRLLAESPFTSHIFSLPDCSYTVSKSHAQAARVVVARELGVRPSFTIEASFCGAGPGTLNTSLQHKHFNPAHLGQMGAGLGDALLKMYHPKILVALASCCPNYAEASLGKNAINKLLNGQSPPRKDSTLSRHFSGSTATSGFSAGAGSMKKKERLRLTQQGSVDGSRSKRRAAMAPAQGKETLKEMVFLGKQRSYKQIPSFSVSMGDVQHAKQDKDHDNTAQDNSSSVSSPPRRSHSRQGSRAGDASNNNNSNSPLAHHSKSGLDPETSALRRAAQGSNRRAKELLAWKHFGNRNSGLLRESSSTVLLSNAAKLRFQSSKRSQGKSYNSLPHF